jgi:glutamate-1-semialdehyde 2,1-aminomutase
MGNKERSFSVAKAAQHTKMANNTESTVDAAVCLNLELLTQARKVIAGGDSSSMRVLPYHLPLVAERGSGSRIWDANGDEYLDLNMAYGPLIFGHRPRHVLDAVIQQIDQAGSQLGFPTEVSIRAAENIQRLFPSMELMRFANSGTEAVASAVRLARAATGRRKLIVFEGHYHGWSEAVFHRYHAPIAELPPKGYGPALPGTAGMSCAIDEVIVCRWNQPELLEQCLAEHGSDVAALVMEPVMGNGGVIPPREDYLRLARYLATEHDALLIFDEVITGMRIAPGGAQQIYGVTPDITVISKVLGSGFPVAAFGASQELMQLIVDRTVFHGGVFSSNACVMAATEASTAAILETQATMYPQLERRSVELASGMRAILSARKIPHLVQHVGALLSLFLTHEPVEALNEYRDVRRHCDFEKFIELQHAMQRRGVYYHPNQFEPMFLSTAHSAADIALFLDRFEAAVDECFA